MVLSAVMQPPGGLATGNRNVWLMLILSMLGVLGNDTHGMQMITFGTRTRLDREGIRPPCGEGRYRIQTSTCPEGLHGHAMGSQRACCHGL